MAEQLLQSVKFKRNHVANFAVFLFFAMIVGEIVLAIAIPIYMHRADSLAYQVRKLNLLSSIDGARYICNNIPSRSDLSLLEKKLLICAFDDLALYLRKEADHLTIEEIDQIQRVVSEVTRLAAKARSGYTFSQEIKLDTAGYIDSLLQKKNLK